MADAKSQVTRALRLALARLAFGADDTLIVAFSGGQDSTCLLHALESLRRRPRLIAAHVDHALRPESATDAARAAELANSIGVHKAVVVRVDVAAYRKQRASWSVQHAARSARYQALARLVEDFHAQALLTGHTADDQAETVLANLVRGTGLAGLAGMRLDEHVDVARLGPQLVDHPTPKAPLRLARPLLRVSRATTLAYCSQLGLSVVEDASNLSRVYTRNRIRLELLPALERFNPAIRTVLTRTADLAAEDLEALQVVVEALHASLARLRNDDELEYNLRRWRAQPRGIQRRLLRHGLERMLGDLVDVPATPVEDALELLRSGHRGQAYHLPYGIELCIAAEHAILRRFGRATKRKLANNLGTDAPRV